jgi:hypothetical protein
VRVPCRNGTDHRNIIVKTFTEEERKTACRAWVVKRKEIKDRGGVGKAESLARASGSSLFGRDLLAGLRVTAVEGKRDLDCRNFSLRSPSDPATHHGVLQPNTDL